MLVTQGVIQGLGVSHKLAQKLVDFWIESLTDADKGESDDEINKRRRELEQRNKLSPDHLVQLAKVTAAAASKPLVEAIGASLLTCASSLTESGRKAVEAQLSSDDALGQFSKREKLKRIALRSSRSSSHSCSPAARKSSPPRRNSLALKNSP